MKIYAQRYPQFCAACLEVSPEIFEALASTVLMFALQSTVYLLLALW